MPEAGLLSEPGVAIVLAEPGAGKSALLVSLAARFGTKPVKASIFERTTAPCIVVDAFDEVARIDPTGLHRALKELRHTGADRTILSSRSGEWSDADMIPLHNAVVADRRANHAGLLGHRVEGWRRAAAVRKEPKADVAIS